MAASTHVTVNKAIERFSDALTALRVSKGASMDTDVDVATTVDGLQTTWDAYTTLVVETPIVNRLDADTDILQAAGVIDNTQMVAETTVAGWNTTVTNLKL